MYKKPITYTDYNGNEKTEDFYFNLNKAELMEWEYSEVGGLKAKIERIVATESVPEIAKLFKEIIVKAYGVKSPDGKRFIKNDEVRDEFLQSDAYSELYMELASSTEAATEFINSIIPKLPQNVENK